MLLKFNKIGLIVQKLYSISILFAKKLKKIFLWKIVTEDKKWI